MKIKRIKSKKVKMMRKVLDFKPRSIKRQHMDRKHCLIIGIFELGIQNLNMWRRHD